MQLEINRAFPQMREQYHITVASKLIEMKYKVIEGFKNMPASTASNA